MNILKRTSLKNVVVTSKTLFKFSFEKITKQNNYYLGTRRIIYFFINQKFNYFE